MHFDQTRMGEQRRVLRAGSTCLGVKVCEEEYVRGGLWADDGEEWGNEKSIDNGMMSGGAFILRVQNCNETLNIQWHLFIRFPCCWLLYPDTASWRLEFTFLRSQFPFLPKPSLDDYHSCLSLYLPPRDPFSLSFSDIFNRLHFHLAFNINPT